MFDLLWIVSLQFIISIWPRYSMHVNAYKSMSAVEPPAHVRDMERVREQVVESMRRVDRIVAALYQARHLSDQERQRINSQPTMFDRADQLLNVLCKKSLNSYQCFLGALIKTNQAHLRDLLTGAGMTQLLSKLYWMPMQMIYWYALIYPLTL